MDFKVDIDKLNDAIITYDNAINLLKENLEALRQSLKIIQESGWSGKAKEKFMTVKYGQWEKGITEHISRLEFLVSMLKTSQSEFEGLESKGNNL